MITIEDFMTEKPFTLRATALIADAWHVMDEHNIRHIPIVDADNQVLGIVSQRDVLAATRPVLKQDGNEVSHVVGMDIPLENIMTRDVSSISKHDSLREAAMFMQSHKYGCLPVIGSGGLIGIITDSDFVAIAINLLEQVEISEDEFEEDNVVEDFEESDELRI